MLSFNLDSETTKLLIALKEGVDEQFELLKSLSPDVLTAIHRSARISMIGASTRIENAILTDSEVSWMDDLICREAKSTTFAAQRHKIEKKLSKDNQRSIEEVVGCREMLTRIYDQGKEFFPLRETIIRGLLQSLHDEIETLWEGSHSRNTVQQSRNVERCIVRLDSRSCDPRA